MRSRSRIVAAALVAAALLLAASAIPPDSKTGYIARMAWFQLEMLAGRVPLDDAEDHLDLTDTERARLAQIPDIRRFGADLGLAVEGHYTTINPTWNRTIYNVSACDPVSFDVVRWWFPIVGRVPYLGYFREQDADRRVRRLEARGLDVYKRTAGAYSTLGWFDDPVLPVMLTWSEERLANTLLHELAHATLWIPGSVAFNESFASFVGDQASLLYLQDRHGPDSPEVAAVERRRHDQRVFRRLLVDLYQDLDAVYTDPARSRDDKLAAKAAILQTLPDRVAASDIIEKDRYGRYVRRDPWNNARLAQFRTYNESPEHFAALFEETGRSFPRFFEAIEAITRRAPDPYAALAEAIGLTPE